MAYHHTEHIKHSHVTQKPSTDLHLGPTHTTPEEFENVAVLVRLGLPSTLRRHENDDLGIVMCFPCVIA